MNTFNKTIKITSILAVLTIIPLHGAIAAVACVPGPTSPTSCGNFTQCPASGTSGNTTNQDCKNNLSPGNWRLGSCTGSNVSEFSGTTLCSRTTGTPAQPGNPDATNGVRCWCKLTSIPGFTVASSAWVFMAGTSNSSNCADNCAYICANLVQSDSLYRSGLFAALGL